MPFLTVHNENNKTKSAVSKITTIDRMTKRNLFYRTISCPAKPHGLCPDTEATTTVRSADCISDNAGVKARRFNVASSLSDCSAFFIVSDTLKMVKTALVSFLIPLDLQFETKVALCGTP